MENTNIKKYLSIKTKITISIVFFVVLILALVFTVSFLNTKRIIRQNLDRRLSDIVSVAVLNIDAEKHFTLNNIEDENTDSYKEIKKKLQLIRDNTSGDITYVYTLRENKKGEIEFIVDAEESEENISHLGDVYEEPNQFLKDNFMTMDNVMVEKDFTTDKWGTWISAFAPFYTSDGERSGILGVDVKASSIVDYENKILFTYISIFILSALLSVLLGFYLSKRIIDSISYLTKAIKNDDKNLGLIYNNDEVGELANVLKTKLDQVHSSKEEAEIHNSNNVKMLERMNKLMIGRELEMIKLKKEISELKKELSNNK